RNLIQNSTITSIFTPLIVGKTVTLVPEEQEIEALSNLLNSELNSDSDFSLVKLTPAHLKVLSQLKTSPPSPLLVKERGVEYFSTFFNRATVYTQVLEFDHILT
ncbi:MAG: hypothetical protein AAFY21_02875, partial [Cyanobacteria bacterium J06641_2]